jgi:hypothetical protein
VGRASEKIAEQYRPWNKIVFYNKLDSLSKSGVHKDTKIHFERKGGFVGNRISAEIDTSLLPQDEKERVQNLVNSSNVLNYVPSSSSPDMPAADLFEYLIIIQTDDMKVHKVEIRDRGTPYGLEPLINYLIQKSRAL